MNEVAQFILILMAEMKASYESGAIPLDYVLGMT